MTESWRVGYVDRRPEIRELAEEVLPELEDGLIVESAARIGELDPEAVDGMLCVIDEGTEQPDERLEAVLESAATEPMVVAVEELTESLVAIADRAETTAIRPSYPNAAGLRLTGRALLAERDGSKGGDLEAIDDQIGDYIHDLRNQLLVANGHLELVQDGLDHDSFGRIEDALGRLEEGLNELRVVAQPEERDEEGP